MNTILQFNFETGDASCKYYQVYVIVNTETPINYAELEDSMMSYIDAVNWDDAEYEDMVEDIMKESGLNWKFADSTFPESQGIYSFWI